MTALARRALLAGLLACLGATFGGCATGPSGRTTVILMPDEDGHVGAVTVSSARGVQPLSDAFGAVTVADQVTAPSGVRPLGREAVEKAYADLIRAQPSKPRSFTLNFQLDSTALTEESRALLPMILQTARQRAPTEISVFGHADASGSESHNVKLSAERARLVAGLLRKSDPTLDDIDVQWFGDRVPLVRSDSYEPRNRRVEIQIL